MCYGKVTERHACNMRGVCGNGLVAGLFPAAGGQHRAGGEDRWVTGQGSIRKLNMHWTTDTAVLEHCGCSAQPRAAARAMLQVLVWYTAAAWSPSRRSWTLVCGTDSCL